MNDRERWRNSENDVVESIIRGKKLLEQFNPPPLIVGPEMFKVLKKLYGDKIEMKEENLEVEKQYIPIEPPTLKINNSMVLLTVTTPMRELLRINSDGEVIAPDLESANEAGRVFVDSIRTYLNSLIDGEK